MRQTMNLLMQIMTALISTSVAAETPGNLHISVNVDSATGMIAASILREVYKQTKLGFVLSTCRHCAQPKKLRLET
jgi:hypothetical protein